MNAETPRKRKRLAIVLGVIFALALLLGPGPGLYLVNPDPAGPHARFLFLGMPIVYVWAVFWFFVQAAVVLAAYFMLWGHTDVPAPRPRAGGE